MLRGWGNYYRWGNSNRKFQQIDSYVHERLAMLASTKYKMRFRRNWASRFDVALLQQQGVYRLTGTVREWPANRLGERCRTAVCGRTACTVG